MLNIQSEMHECSLNPKATGRERYYDDRDQYIKRLSEDESRLFSSVNCNLEVILAQTAQGRHR